MKFSENHIGYIYHLKKAIIYNRASIVFKYIKLISPFLIFLWFIINSYLIIFSIIGIISLLSWLCEVKLSSLRNINYYASKEFKRLYVKEKYNL